MLAVIRRFFEQRGVLEVETPLLCRAGATDPNLRAFTAQYRRPGAATGTDLYLQTSPEFAMKRLLAAGSGSIYQICKAFRNEESGRQHNPEFTLLEWYRVGFSLDALIDEIERLFAEVFRDGPALAASERHAYADIFRRRVGVDPLAATLPELAECARDHGLADAERLCGADRSAWLDLLFGLRVQPHLGCGRVCFVYDYPACLPSLARKRTDDDRVVERVEVFLDGLELGNGFHELADAAEQERRFEHDLAERERQGLSLPPKDGRLLAALRWGLPDCSGVAIGLDRLLMVLGGADDMERILAFPIGRA
jgi:lysyl-tRNA synthetase class 2